jgi:hypothetical protein
MMKKSLSILLALCALLGADAPETVTYSSDKIASPKKAVPYDADLYHKNIEVVSAHVEFLYWVAQEGALDYALKMDQDPWGPANCYAEGDFQTGTYDLDPGFRIAGSSYNAPKYWELKAQYTRLTNRGSNSSGRPDSGSEYLNGTWPQIFAGADPVQKARSVLHLNYNIANVGIARMFNPNPHLRMRLITDIITAWINQDWRVHYTSADGFQTKIGSRWGFIGAGMTIGTTADWFWGSDVYMTGKASVSLLLGQYKNHATQYSNYAASEFYDTALALRNAHYQDTRAIYAPQIQFGPCWEKNYSNSRWEVFAGYELIAWFNLQEVYRSTSGAGSNTKETLINTGLLALQGLTTRVTVDF